MADKEGRYKHEMEETKQAMPACLERLPECWTKEMVQTVQPGGMTPEPSKVPAPSVESHTVAAIAEEKCAEGPPAQQQQPPEIRPAAATAEEASSHGSEDSSKEPAAEHVLQPASMSHQPSASAPIAVVDADASDSAAAAAGMSAAGASTEIAPPVDEAAYKQGVLAEWARRGIFARGVVIYKRDELEAFQATQQGVPLASYDGDFELYWPIPCLLCPGVAASEWGCNCCTAPATCWLGSAVAGRNVYRSNVAAAAKLLLLPISVLEQGSANVD